MTEKCIADSYNCFLGVTDGCWAEREKKDQDSQEYLITCTMILNSNKRNFCYHCRR